MRVLFLNQNRLDLCRGKVCQNGQDLTWVRCQSEPLAPGHLDVEALRELALMAFVRNGSMAQEHHLIGELYDDVAHRRTTLTLRASDLGDQRPYRQRAAVADREHPVEAVSLLELELSCDKVYPIDLLAEFQAAALDPESCMKWCRRLLTEALPPVRDLAETVRRLTRQQAVLVARLRDAHLPVDDEL